MRAVVLVFCLTGCDALFRLAEVKPDAPGSTGIDASDRGDDAGMNCFTETFSGSNSDLAVNWDFYADSATCSSNVTNGELVVGIDPNVTCYSEVRLRPRPLAGAQLTVKVPSPLTPTRSQTYFALYLDSMNYYYFDCGSGYLDAVVQLGGTDMHELTLQYNTASHLYWRMKHDPVGKRIEFWTSPNGTEFTFRHSIGTEVLPIDSLRVSLGAGTYNGGQANPGLARFDDFELCTP